MHWITAELGVILTLIAVQCLPESQGFTLTVLHTNDVHSRFLETSKHSGACADKDKLAKKCFGGFARLHHKVKEIRATGANVVYLSGGDYYQGTVWYTMKKWRVVSHFVNQLNHTAMAIGNHEFDDNVSGLIPFLESVTFPVISSNIDASTEPGMQGKFTKSVVVEYEGRKVGIIGYTTVESTAISNPGTLKFEDELEAVTKEAQRLHDEGVNILIAVGHAGYDVDMKIATAPYIDLVVGGHTNTFLYSGKAPSIEVPLGEYPTIITQESGRKVPVVQAYAFGKYLGYLNLTFNDEGEVVSWSGNPILMDGSIPQDEEMLNELESWAVNITLKTKQEVGKTRVFLVGSERPCRLEECNLGNLIADAMVHVNLKFADELYWSDVSIAILNSGGIRSSIDETSKKGSISLEDVLTVIPFTNTIDLIEIRGEHLRAAFEFSVDGYDPAGIHLPGKFLQVSGIRVVYDLSKPKGQRVKSLDVVCTDCRVPTYEPLNDTAVYKVVLPTYMATGGDGYEVIKRNIITHHIPGFLDSDTLLEYLKERSPIIQGLEGRIRFAGPELPCSPDPSENEVLPKINDLKSGASHATSAAIYLILTALIALLPVCYF